MSFIDAILNRIADEDVDFSIKIACKDDGTALQAANLEVQYPSLAKTNNVITLSGGCLAKLTLRNSLSEILGNGSAKETYDGNVRSQRVKIEDAFELIDAEAENTSLSDYNSKIRLLINDLLVNQVDDRDYVALPRFSIALTKVENDILSLK